MEDAYLRLAENAALLYEIGNKPIPPGRNDPIAANSQKGRTFGLTEEMNITNCITYLASYSDHPGEVMALCVEEMSDNAGLIISIANNTISTSDLEEGTRGIADILQQQSNGW